jgi:hypothetical protein
MLMYALPFLRRTSNESMETFALPVLENEPWMIAPDVPPLTILSETMTPAAVFASAGPWMCAALAGPLQSVTVAEYDTVVVEFAVLDVNPADPVAVVVTGGTSASPVSVAVNVSGLFPPPVGSSSSQATIVTAVQARSAEIASRAFIVTSA